MLLTFRKRLRVSLVLLGLLIFLANANAQNKIWEQAGKIPGGAAAHLIVDSLGIIYTGTDMQGVYRSTDNGSSWHLENTGLGGTYVFSFALESNGNILAATNFGLYRSTDHGSNWQSIRSFFQPHSVVSNSLGHLFVGCEQDWSIGDFYRSTNGGINWDRISFPGYHVVFSLVATSSDWLFAGTEYGVFRSTNNATGWDSVNTGLTTHAVWCLARNAANVLFAGTYLGGVFRTTNNGDSWQQAGLTGKVVECLSVASNGHVLAATLEGIFRSTDDGLTWQSINAGVTNMSIISIAAGQSGVAFAGTFGSGVFRSLDNGNTWAQVVSGMWNPTANYVAVDLNNYLYAGLDYGGGVVRSADDGETWETMGLQGVGISCLAVRSSEVLYAANDLGVYKTSNHGETWALASVWQGSDRDIGGIASNSNGHVFVARDSTVYRSIDGGTTWMSLLAGLPGSTILDIAVDSSGYLFAAALGRGVYRSSNNGDSWVRMSEGIIGGSAVSVAVNVNGDIYAVSDTVFRSTDEGATWHLATTGVPLHNFWSITFNAWANVFIGGSGSRIFRSVNNGTSWSDFSAGLPGTYVSNLVTNSGGTLFASSLDGVFRTVRSTTGTARSSSPVPPQFILDQNYPNPFNPTTAISYRLTANSFVGLKVYDILGREVATLVNEAKPAGEYTVTFDASNLASGVYTYQLAVDGFRLNRKMLLLR